MTSSDFPWLGEDQYYPFPPPSSADSQGIVAMGGNLSPGMLLSAYRQGIFPWYNPGESILWWSLDPRFVLYPENLHVSTSMAKFLKSHTLKITMDQAFSRVMENCRSVNRRGQQGSWITREMKEAYREMHLLGYAHSVEVWQEDSLVGGLYGISLGRAFFGESMFSHLSNSSKLALIELTALLRSLDFHFIDCQQHTPHLGSLGAKDVPRDEFLGQLKGALELPTLQGNWMDIYNKWKEEQGKVQ